jgi:VWFA-related protein
LKILVPEETNLRLFTETGNIDITLNPASLVVNSKTGNISLNFPETINADLTLSSNTGSVKSTKYLTASTNVSHSFYKQFGKGGTIISAHSDQGNITLETRYISTSEVATLTPNKPSDIIISKSNDIKTNNLPSLNPNSTNSAPNRPILRRNDGTNETNSSENSSNSRNSSSRNDNNSNEDGVIKIESQLVTLNASALNTYGQPITNLSKSDFTLYEDGIQQEIVHFQSVNTPFNLVLLIDLSGSLKEKIRLLRRSAWSFIQATRPEDKVAIVTFTSTTRLVCPLTNDRELLRSRLEDIRDTNGGTNFYDAVQDSLTWVLDKAKNERNSIVIMSDGVDNALPDVPGRGSRISFNELVDKVQESNTTIFPIYLDTEEEVLEETGMDLSRAYAMARDQLKSLAEVTGGSIFYANRLEDLSGCYEKVAAELRTIYSLGYYPTNGQNDGGFRKIRLRVNKDNIKVKTRRGYYAKTA